nr:hypothetical protein [Mucilaginibacter sp. X5P1]
MNKKSSPNNIKIHCRPIYGAGKIKVKNGFSQKNIQLLKSDFSIEITLIWHMTDKFNSFGANKMFFTNVNS